MRALFVLVRLRLKEMFGGVTASAFYLGVPLVLALMVGAVFANGHPFERRTVAIVGEQTPTEKAILDGFPELRVGSDKTAEIALSKLRSRSVNAVLLAGPEPRVLVGRRDELFGRGLAAALSARATVEVQELPRWGYVHFLFPGMLVITIIAGGLLGMGYGMVRYRSNQFLKKLSTTPLSRATFVAAQLGARSLVVLGQVAVLVALAVLFFDLPLTVGAALWIAPLSLLGLLVFSGVGFALGSFVKSEANLLDAINLLFMPVVFLSEIFFSIDELPAPLAHFAAALPSTQLTRLFRAVLLHGDGGLASLGPGLAILAAWALVTFAVSVRSFRWHDG
jgi:ABC-2 type transport system permease protein